jgi:Protein of unknown function (DUF3043)
MFGRKSETPPPAPATPDKADGKGRPTPTRKEAEAARKASLTVPSDPKEAKKAMRERERASRQAGRAALAAGDESALPARDQGPVRARIRDIVDSRRSIGEIFIPVAILVLITGFLKNPLILSVTYYAWLVLLAITVLDSIWISLKIKRTITAELPDASLKFGDYLYGIMRGLTIRRLRLPKPKVGPGGKQVTPK